MNANERDRSAANARRSNDTRSRLDARVPAVRTGLQEAYGALAAYYGLVQRWHLEVAKRHPDARERTRHQEYAALTLDISQVMDRERGQA